MPEFLAETYTPRDAAATGDAAPRTGDIARAADQPSGPGGPVCFLGAIVVPEEETCFWLYQAPSADAVREAMTAARLRPERITRAVTVRPPRARPGPAPRIQGTTGPPAPSPDPQGTSSRPPHRTSRPGPPARPHHDRPGGPAAGADRPSYPAVGQAWPW
jgi:hypothetical protein